MLSKETSEKEKWGQPHFESITQVSGGAIFVHEPNQYCWHYINVYNLSYNLQAISSLLIAHLYHRHGFILTRRCFLCEEMDFHRLKGLVVQGALSEYGRYR